MTLRNRKRLLVLATLLLLAATAGVWQWGLQEPPQPDLAPARLRVRSGRSSGAAKTGATQQPPLSQADFASVWERPLRRPLYDPPPPKPKPVEKPQPEPIRATLVATMTNADNAALSHALIRLSNGQQVFLKVGQSLGPENKNVEIVEIQDGLVRVRRGKEELELKVNY